jgi:hypothetical protein
VTIQSSGTLSPGALLGTTSTLTISNSLTLAGTTWLALNPGTGASDQVRGLTSVTYGGTLALTNVNGALAASNSFKLFTAASYKGAFASVSPTIPAPGLAWNTSTLSTDGTLRLVSTVNAAPTNLTAAVSNNILTLAWPADHIGWRLQSQTNGTAAGLGTNWVDVTGGAATNQMNFTLAPDNGTVFFRMIFP